MLVSSSLFFSLAVARFVGASSDVPPDLFGGGAKKECPPFRCRRGEEAVPKKGELKLTSTGSCAGLGGGGMTMFNAKQKDDPLSPCCDVRQACEQICGSTLKQCDEAMEVCMNATCAAADSPEDCERSASIHKLMTQIGDGCAKMVPAQKANCECVKADEAPERRKHILTDLYTKNDGDLSKIDKLVEKANSPKKFASLLSKLVDKYQKTTIIHKKDPQASYLDNLMKNAAAKAAAAKGEEEDNVEEDGDVVDLDDHTEEL